VLPPVCRLTRDQAMYQYLAGYTAKVAGTEVGVTEPKATFSACFGAPFLALHPTAYATILGKKMDEHGSRAYLVNTGWTGGGYGVGKRMSLKATRAIISAIFDGSWTRRCATLPLFGLQYPTSVPGVDPAILNPRSTGPTHTTTTRPMKLASMFIDAFRGFTDTPEGKRSKRPGRKSAECGD
jgi:phosphoenolpyruvate carboxykinase (ATP)